VIFRATRPTRLEGPHERCLATRGVQDGTGGGAQNLPLGAEPPAAAAAPWTLNTWLWANTQPGDRTPIAGESLLIVETEPAGYIAFAANEALKTAHVKLIDAQLFGAYGRLYMSGPEAEIDAARDGAMRGLETIKGKEPPKGEGR